MISKLIQIIGKKFQILLKINSTMDIFFDTMRENVQIHYFPVFGLNTDQKNSVFGHFKSRSVSFLKIWEKILMGR